IRRGLGRQALIVSAAVWILLVAGFAYTMIRSHAETVALAEDWIRGRQSSVNRGALMVAAAVRDMPPNLDERASIEHFRAGGPRARGSRGPSDYLFVWGNWPEVYYLSGLLPASGYLSAQPLTGLPADVWYGSEEYHLILDEGVATAARAEMLRELQRTPP